MTARKLMLISTLVVTPLTQAIDIPMDRKLAADLLDSKTCYTTITSDKGLLGYELNDLLISSFGKLTTLQAQAAYAAGELRPRQYKGNGIFIEILPKRSHRQNSADGITSTIEESGSALIVEGTQRRLISVKVVELCSP